MKKVFEHYCNVLIPALLRVIEQYILNRGKLKTPKLLTKPWLLRRGMNQGTATVFCEFETEDPKDYKSYKVGKAAVKISKQKRREEAQMEVFSGTL